MALSLLINVVLVIILAIIVAVKWGHKDIRVPRFRRRPLQRGDVVWCKRCKVVTEITKFLITGPTVSVSPLSVIGAEHEGIACGLPLPSYKRVSKKVEVDYRSKMSVAMELRLLNRMVRNIVEISPGLELDIDSDTGCIKGVRVTTKKDAEARKKSGAAGRMKATEVAAKKVAAEAFKRLEKS